MNMIYKWWPYNWRTTATGVVAIFMLFIIFFTAATSVKRQNAHAMKRYELEERAVRALEGIHRSLADRSIKVYPDGTYEVTEYH